MEFRDLKLQYKHLKVQIDKQIAEVISSAHFISGEQVNVLEQQLATYVGVKHCITCANGTDAISIALLAYGIGEGDAVFVPDFTFFSSGECPATVGATPIFVDVCSNTYNIDPDALENAIDTIIRENKLLPKAVIAVDLFGQPYNYEAVKCICNKHGLLLLEDAAQGFGGKYTMNCGEAKRACSLGDIATTSFFPAKPFGCYGDGGAIFTNNDEIAAVCRSIAVHGRNANDKYDNIRLGMNSRLDTLQAAILLAKFETFKKYELRNVNKFASLYLEQLKDVEGLVLPIVPESFFSSWAQYTIQLPEGADRLALQSYMKGCGVPTMVYYARPMHKQGAFIGTRSAVASCPNTENLCKRVLCLPIHPYLTEDEVGIVADTLKKILYERKYL